MENTNQTFALDTNADFMNAFMNAVNQHIDKRVEKRINETNTNAQIMAVLDTQLETKIKGMIDAAICDHNENRDHPDNDDIRNVVEDMDQHRYMTDKIKEIVNETDMSSNLESAIETYLNDHDYAKEEYVDDKMDNLEDNDGFKSAVRSIVQDMSFEIRVNSF